MLLVSASHDGSPVVVLVDTDAEGVTRHDTPSSRGGYEATYVFDGATVLGVLGDGAPSPHAAV